MGEKAVPQYEHRGDRLLSPTTQTQTTFPPLVRPFILLFVFVAGCNRTPTRLAAAKGAPRYTRVTETAGLNKSIIVSRVRSGYSGLGKSIRGDERHRVGEWTTAVQDTNVHT